jgi:hypothetical protein
VTLFIDDRRVSAFATTVAQRVLDRLAEGLIDEPQDELVTGTAQAIEEMMRSALPPSVEVWNRAWDL